MLGRNITNHKDRTAMTREPGRYAGPEHDCIKLNIYIITLTNPMFAALCSRINRKKKIETKHFMIYTSI
jgi:hypothetical protein